MVEVLEQGDWWTIGISDKWGPPVPYPAVQRPDGAVNHGFVDLRENLDLIESIPEVQDSEGMKALLRVLNAPTSPFRSFGCEHSQPGPLDPPVPDGPTHSMGCYVDLAFVDVEANDQPAIVALARRVKDLLPLTVNNWVSVDLLAEKLKWLEGREDRHGLFIRVQGLGLSEDQARTVFEAGVQLLAGAFRTLAAPHSPAI
jgi:hypothetical protein